VELDLRSVGERITSGPVQKVGTPRRVKRPWRSRWLPKRRAWRDGPTTAVSGSVPRPSQNRYQAGPARGPGFGSRASGYTVLSRRSAGAQRRLQFLEQARQLS